MRKLGLILANVAVLAGVLLVHAPKANAFLDLLWWIRR
jgi:hypothetical protein